MGLAKNVDSFLASPFFADLFYFFVDSQINMAKE